MTKSKKQPDSGHASPYAGRWVARLRGKIIAQGNTPEEARRAAQTHRHKESPEIVFMPSPFSFPPLLASVHEALPSEQEIYLVGGAVRDASWDVNRTTWIFPCRPMALNWRDVLPTN